MKNIFRDDERYSDVANTLDEETHALLKPLFQRYVSEGYSPRQISHLMHLTVLDLETTSVLELVTPKHTTKFSRPPEESK
jgi:hypothetical protein